MSSEGMSGLGRWKETRQPRAGSQRKRVSTRKWLGITVLTALLLVTTGIIVSICIRLFWSTVHEPRFESLVISRFRLPWIPSIPQAEADQRRIQRETRLLRTVDGEEPDSRELTREVIEERLEKLSLKGSNDPVVVYVSTHALIDESGGVQLMAHESEPFTPETLIPLKRVLDLLLKCPASSKLLVLDVMPDQSHPLLLGSTPAAIADLVPRELSSLGGQKSSRGGPIAVLLPCSAGEVAHWSEDLKQSVFGHFFVSGMRQREADVNRDHAVSLEELAQFLDREVDSWVLRHRGERQRPRLLGSTPDFPLSLLNLQKQKPQDSPKKTDPEADSPSKKEEPKADSKSDDSAEKSKSDPKKPDEKSGKSDPDADAKRETRKPDPSEPSYPAWLARGWALRDQWARGPELSLGPRLFRQLEFLLERAELDWRLGGEAEKIQPALEEAISELSAKLAQAQKTNGPPDRSAGQALARGAKPDPALVKGLAELLEQVRGLDTQLNVNADARAAKLNELVAGFSKMLKDKKSIDLALALVEVAKDRLFRLDTQTIRLIDSIVEVSKLGRDAIELRLLQQLSLRPPNAGAKDGDDELFKRIWDTVVLAEQSNNRAPTFRWVRGRLQEADALRHEAELRLLPQSMGYSSARQLDQSWQKVTQAYRFIDSCQNDLDRAQSTLILARSELPSYLSYLEAVSDQSRSSQWLQTAATAQDLDDLLGSLTLDDSQPPPSQDQLEALTRNLNEKTRQLQTQLDDLRRPFRPESVRRLIVQSDQDPSPGLDREIDAMLRVSLLGPRDRQDLWSAARKLNRRLDQRLLRGVGASADSDSPRSRLPLARGVVETWRKRLVALLRIADPKAPLKGLEADGIEPIKAASTSIGTSAESSTDIDLLANIWGELARTAGIVRGRMNDALGRGERRPSEDRPAWVLPASKLDLSQNPIRLSRDEWNRAVWAWLARRYDHESHDLQGPLATSDTFLERASIENATESDAHMEPALSLSLPRTSGDALRLSSRQPRTSIDLLVLLEGNKGGLAMPVSMTVLETDDPRLKVSVPQPQHLDLPPDVRTPIRLQVEWEENKLGDPVNTPRGVIVRARLGDGESYHLLVPIDIVTDMSLPQMVVRTDPAVNSDVTIDPMRLRTLPGKQSFYVVVRSESPVDRKVFVDFLSGETQIATSADKDKDGLTVNSRKPVTVGFGEPAARPDAKPTDPLPEVPQALSLRLRDAVSGQEYQRMELRPVIAAPLEFLEVVKAQYTPPRPGVPNRLEVLLRALPEMKSPPCPVTLDIPADKDLFPAFVEPPNGTTLKESVEPGGKLSNPLFAENIKLNPAAKEEGAFSLSVDGMARALWFQTHFVMTGQAQKVMPMPRARVRFQTDYPARPEEPSKLNVRFQVDNAPPDAQLQFRLGHHEKNGDFKDDLSIWNAQAKRRHIGFDPRSKDGAVLFEASVDDWSREFDVGGQRGRRYLYVYLRSARGDLLDQYSQVLVLDDLSPQVTVEAPTEIEASTQRLPIRAAVKPTESGVKDVSFILNPGTKGDFTKAEAENNLSRGQPSKDDPNTWEAVLQVPKGSTGTLVVSVRATSRAGLKGLDHAEINVREPEPDPATVAKVEKEKPGTIMGKVTENDIIQAGLTVYLYDPNAKDKENLIKGQMDTPATGMYVFTDLKPGPYRIYCEKSDNGRSATEDVILKSGQTLTKDLDLLKH